MWKNSGILHRGFVGFLLVFCSSLLTAAERTRLDGKKYEDRALAFSQYVASVILKPNAEFVPKASAPAYAAKILADVDRTTSIEKIGQSAERLVQRYRDEKRRMGAKASVLDPFDKVALVNAFFLCRSFIPASIANQIRDYVSLYQHREWRGYGAMNYRLMNDGAGFLAAEEWPDLVDQDGLNATAIAKATRERLFGYFDQITRQNFHEYGCPIYLAVDLSAVRMLAEYARDEVMRQRATLTLDAMMLDMACHWNSGFHAGSAARAKYWGSTDTGPEAMGSTATVGWLFYGAYRSISAEGTGWIHSYWMAAPGRYRVPELICRVANSRQYPSLYRGRVTAMRENVCRTTFHSWNYSLGSQWELPTSATNSIYKEARRQMLKWKSASASSTFAVCMENPYRPYRLQENRANVLGYGENPYSRLMQSDATLLGLYDVPASYPYYKMYVPFSSSGSILKRIERDGWIFCHNGSMLMAFRSLEPCQWGKKWGANDMLWCEQRRNAWVLETAELRDFAGGGVDEELQRFISAIMKRVTWDVSRMKDQLPTIAFTNLSGKRMQLTWQPHGKPYTGQASIDGVSLSYLDYPMHDSPWVKQTANSPVLQIAIEGKKLDYDFTRWIRHAY